MSIKPCRTCLAFVPDGLPPSTKGHCHLNPPDSRGLFPPIADSNQRGCRRHVAEFKPSPDVVAVATFTPGVTVTGKPRPIEGDDWQNTIARPGPGKPKAKRKAAKKGNRK